MTLAPKLSNRAQLRVFGVAFGGLFGVATVVTFLALRSVSSSTTATSVLGAFVFFGLIGVGPAGAPAALAMALLAIRSMNREPLGRTLWFWAWRGIAAGALLGAVGTTSWFAVIFIGVPDHLMRIIGPAAAMGAGSGAGVGVLMACYCWHVRR